jgi:hypothetical protein
VLVLVVVLVSVRLVLDKRVHGVLVQAMVQPPLEHRLLPSLQANPN